MKILVTGAGGQLGRAVGTIFGRRHEVLALTHADLDVTSRGDVEAACLGARPDWIVHAAAYTNVDGAEKEGEVARNVNSLGTRHVAQAAARVGASVLYFSSDYVFSGEADRPYREYAATHPINHYGLTKLEGESWLAGTCPRYLVVRTSWLFGGEAANFVTTVAGRARTAEELRVVEDQRGSPTYVRDLARMSLRLIEEDRVGLYHTTNSGEASWFDMACEIVSLLKLDCRILPISTEASARAARRPPYSVLDNYSLRLAGFPKMRSWKSALRESLEGADV